MSANNNKELLKALLNLTQFLKEHTQKLEEGLKEERELKAMMIKELREHEKNFEEHKKWMRDHEVRLRHHYREIGRLKEK